MIEGVVVVAALLVGAWVGWRFRGAGFDAQFESLEIARRMLEMQSHTVNASATAISAAGDRSLQAADEVMKKARDQEGVAEHMKATGATLEKLVASVDSLDRVVGTIGNIMVNSGLVREFRTGGGRDDVQVGQQPITRSAPPPGESHEDFDRPL